MADEEVKIEDQDDLTPEIEVDDVVVPAEEVPAEDEVSALDNLGNVVDAHITKDDEAATAAFHDYLTQKVKSTLNPETADSDEAADDSVNDDGSVDSDAEIADVESEESKD